MKLKQIHMMLEKTSPGVRAKVLHHLAVNRVMERHGVTFNDLQKISHKQEAANNKVVKAKGPDGQELKNLLQNSLIAVGKLMDSGLELGEAIKKVTEDFVQEPAKIHGVNKLDSKYEDQVRNGVANEVQKAFIEDQGNTGFNAVWDSSLAVVATTLRATSKLADAIEAGLQNIKESNWYKNLTDKADFDKKYVEHLNNEYLKFEEGQQRSEYTSIKNAIVDAKRPSAGKVFGRVKDAQADKSAQVDASEELKNETKKQVKSQDKRTIEHIMRDRDNIKADLKNKWKNHIRGGSAGMK